jgi:hypothetical protein
MLVQHLQDVDRLGASVLQAAAAAAAAVHMLRSSEHLVPPVLVQQLKDVDRLGASVLQAAAAAVHMVYSSVHLVPPVLVQHLQDVDRLGASVLQAAAAAAQQQQHFIHCKAVYIWCHHKNQHMHIQTTVKDIIKQLQYQTAAAVAAAAHLRHAGAVRLQ